MWFLATFTASLSPNGIKLAAELLASLPLLDELPLLSRAANGLTGGRRGELSMKAAEACHRGSDNNNWSPNIKLYLRPCLLRVRFPLSF